MEYNTTIKITFLNHSFMRIEAERGILREIHEYFSFFAQNYKYLPKYKAGIWDGKIRLFDLNKRTMHCGLIYSLQNFAKKRNYKLIGDDNIIIENNKIPENSGYIIAKKVNATRTPRDYQNAAVVEALTKKRIILLSAVNSGKSFIIYLIARYLMSLKKRILIVVPSISLVVQMKNDFDDYNSKNDTSLSIQCINGGTDKNSNAMIQISTWQNIYNLPKEWFDKFQVVFGDEVHTFKATSLIKFMDKCENCEYRIGTTGTLDDIQVNKMTLIAQFGKIFKGKTSHELIDEGISSTLKIGVLKLNYPKSELDKFEEKTELILRRKRSNIYFLSKLFIAENKLRNEFIKKLAWGIDGNTVILIDFVQAHGKILNELLKKEGKIVYFYHGDVSREEREYIRQQAEKNNNVIIVASYGTFQQGINIINLKNLILASPSKSRIRVLQSIGRVLRKGNGINNARVYDLSDNLKYKSTNILMNHMQKRIEMYDKEQFPHKIIEVKL